ncbi:MAG: hypothetical protein WEC75_09975 [Dehalococcoidia bacterium]
MPGDTSDKVQREIEELLDKLDNFVPEERFTEKIRARKQQRAQPSGPRPWDRVRKRLSRVTLGQAMLVGLALLFFAFLFDGPLGAAANYLIITGLVLAGGAFVMSVVTGGGTRRTVTGSVEKRWRGQVIEYQQPASSNRLLDWLRGRRRR